MHINKLNTQKQRKMQTNAKDSKKSKGSPDYVKEPALIPIENKYKRVLI